MPAKPKEAKAAPEAEQRPLFETSRKVLLAAIGAMALAQDEIEEFVTRLVERGEIADREGRQLVQEMREKRKVNAAKAEEQFASHVEKVLNRLNIPSKADIETLGEKIAALSKKIDDLSKSS
jgi:poly(hydroxyalkanoate) granule-associated protein